MGQQTDGSRYSKISPRSRPGQNKMHNAVDNRIRMGLPGDHIFFKTTWWRGTVVERRSLAGELSLYCARPAADG